MTNYQVCIIVRHARHAYHPAKRSEMCANVQIVQFKKCGPSAHQFKKCVTMAHQVCTNLKNAHQVSANLKMRAKYVPI